MTTKELAAKRGWELIEVDGIEYAVEPGWWADDGNAEVRFPSAASGAEAAEEYVAGGDFGGAESTDWIDVWAWREASLIDEDGDEVEEQLFREPHTVPVHPPEPDCREDDTHMWRSPLEVVGGCDENPGVWGHGGGVVITEVCRHCGRYRVTDSWAQRPDTGEQGLESVTYRDADEASLRWIEAEAADAADDKEDI